MKITLALLVCFAIAPGCGGGAGGGGGDEPALAGLAVSAGALSPSFRPDVLAYVVGPSSTLPAFVTVTPRVAHTGETVSVQGLALASGTASSPIHLGLLTNGVSIVVHAPDGIRRRVYTVAFEVTSGDLLSLQVTAGQLVPDFLPSITSYVVGPPITVDSSVLVATAADPGATVTVNGQVVASGTSSLPLPVTGDQSTVTVVVTARDGRTKTYTVTLDRVDAIFFDDFSSPTLGPLWLGTGARDPAVGVPPPSLSLAPGDALTYVGTPVSAAGGVTLTIDVQRDGAAAPKITLFNAAAPTLFAFWVELSVGPFGNQFDAQFVNHGASGSILGPLPPDDHLFHKVELKITPAGVGTFSWDGTVLGTALSSPPSDPLRFTVSHRGGGVPTEVAHFDDVTLQSP